jgi:two-component system LytT family response regulator
MPDVMRVLIVDDEPLARDCIRLALAEAQDVEIAGECGDGREAVDAIRRLAPDVVFLDVQMPGVDGFRVVERIGAERMPPTVFVTAYDAHAVRAFDVHALDYVLKPFDNARLLGALERARAARRRVRDGALSRRLAALLEQWSRGAGAARPGPTRATRRITVRDGDHIRLVVASDVDWIEAAGNYVVLHVGHERHRLRMPLQELARDLDPGIFVQIHRSTVVNLDRVREIQPWYGGDYLAILRDGTKLRVSRTRAGKLLGPLA